MGLASALAASQGQAGQPPPAYGAPQPYPGQNPAGAQGWGVPAAGSAPGAAPYPNMQQQQQAYPNTGAAATYPQLQQFGGAPSPASTAPSQALQQGMASVLAAKLAKTVAANQLQVFYSPDRLKSVTDRILQKVDFHQLAARWRMPTELAIDLAALALYDIVIYADDSGSMESDNGERIEDLKLIMAKVAEVASLFDEDGIEVRFINADIKGSHIKHASDASRLLQHLEYRWDTKLATQMENKILRPMAYNAHMNKPLLIITITDGEPSDKPQDKIISVIQECRQRLVGQYGPKAVAFQFAQVGKDRDAQEFLARLDKHPQIGKMIDCTSYYELESTEYAAKGINLSVEAWLVKLMVGAIDPDYDEQDEAPGGSHSAAAGPGGYSQQQQYAQQPYGQPGGFIQQPGGYPQQQPGGYPVGYPQQQQHGHKPKKGFMTKLFG